jgi:serine/threonine protein kinase
MGLSPGARLGPYEIVAALGAGGMGEVYRAKDSRLNRTVAIKVLPTESAVDPDRRERFEREAKAISALDHPNICALYDVGEHEGTYFLVMPCLEGQTLAERLAKGALPPDQAIKIGIEIATALDAAHRHGIVHRDLKPGNVMLTKTGVKLLDFGLAKLKKAGGPLTYSGMAHLAGETTQASGTGIGTLLGTMPYMSPEQVEGRDVDARSDIFSLGAVIYEMITGERAFKGDTAASLIGAILKDEPTPIAGVQPLTPAVLDHVVTVSLAKDPDERWQSAADVARQLKWIAQGGSEGSAPTVSRTRTLAWPGALLALAAAIALAAIAWPASRPATETARVVRFEVMPPAGAALSESRSSIGVYQSAASPDGTQIAFVASVAGKLATLWLRNVDGVATRELPGTAGAADPFWSPDSRAIGFFAGARLKTIDVSTGNVRDLTSASTNSRGGSWSRNGTILFSSDSASPLTRIPATGGTPVAITSVGEGISHRWPWFLPDGEHFLFFARAGADDRGIFVGSLAGGQPRLVLKNLFAAQYANGYLLTVRDGSLLAYPFDEQSLTLRDVPVPVANQVGGSATQQGSFSVSDEVLIHGAGLGVTTELRWFDRTGQGVGTPVDRGNIANFSLAPDDSRVALAKVDPASNTADIWLVELKPGITTRFTLDSMNDLAPRWAPGGDRIVFRSDRFGGNNLFVKPAASAVRDEMLLKRELSFPSDWSPDGKYILYHQTIRLGSFDISASTLDGNTVIPVAATPFDEYDGQFSPDGRLVAYVSDESGRPEVYVQTFPPSGRRWTVSLGGGNEPRWRGDGRELFFLSANGALMSAAIPASGPSAEAAPKRLFATNTPTFGNPYRINLDATRDGQRFLINTVAAVGDVKPLSVVVNWIKGLEPTRPQ